MVEEIEELEPNLQRSALPAGDLRALRDCEIGVEIARVAKVVSALGKRHQRTVARTRPRRQVAGVEACFTLRLHEEGVWIGNSRAVLQHKELWWPTRMQIQHKGRRLPACRWFRVRADRNGIDLSKIVVSLEVS